MNFDLKAADIAIVIATLAGSVLAVQAQKWLERGREIKQRRANIFRTLMATRASFLSGSHVEAFDAVPIEFYGRSKELKNIVDSWKVCFDHLCKRGIQEDVWGIKKTELYVDLLSKMASYIGYNYNKVEIEKEIYAPEGHRVVESDQDVIRRGLAALLKGDVSLNIDVNKLPSNEKAASDQEELRTALLKFLNSSGTKIVVGGKTEGDDL